MLDGAPNFNWHHDAAADSIMPPRSTPLEHVLDIQEGRILDIPVPLRELWDPQRCPEHLLPYLAWALSVDIWRDDWPVERKRYVCAEAFTLHRLKGTIEGFRRHIRLVDADLAGYIRPPDKFFPERAYSAAERRRFLARFQQLRVYKFRDRGTATFGAYTNSGYRLPRLFAGQFFPAVSDAEARWGPQGYLYEPRTDTEVKLKTLRRRLVETDGTAVDIERHLIPARHPFALFGGGRQRRQLFAYDVDSRSRVVELQRETTYTRTDEFRQLKTIQPAGKLIRAQPREVAEKGVIRTGQMFPGDVYRRTRERQAHPLAPQVARKSAKIFLPETTAPTRIYSQLHIHDPQRLSGRRSRTSFAGYVRLGLPAFHGVLKVDATERVSKFAFGRFVGGYLVTAAHRKLHDSIDAARISKSFRDKIQVTSRIHRAVKVGDARLVGEVRVGDWLRETK